MIVQDFGIKVKVRWDKRPSNEEWDKTEKGASRLVSPSAACFDDVK